jgi:hypothetical protein
MNPVITKALWPIGIALSVLIIVIPAICGIAHIFSKYPPPYQVDGLDQAYYPVAERAAQCMDLHTALNIPQNYLNSFGPPFEKYISQNNDTAKPKELSNAFRKVIGLSSLIFQERGFYYVEMRRGWWVLTPTEIMMILIGFLTTVVVAASTEFRASKAPWAPWLRILAIVLPAAGAAAVSANAFFNPLGSVSAKGQTLDSLVRLQDNIALTVWDLRCEGDDKSSAQIADWQAEHDKILASSVASPQTSEHQKAATGQTAPQ